GDQGHNAGAVVEGEIDALADELLVGGQRDGAVIRAALVQEDGVAGRGRTYGAGAVVEFRGDGAGAVRCQRVIHVPDGAGEVDGHRGRRGRPGDGRVVDGVGERVRGDVGRVRGGCVDEAAVGVDDHAAVRGARVGDEVDRLAERGRVVGEQARQAGGCRIQRGVADPVVGVVVRDGRGVERAGHQRGVGVERVRGLGGGGGRGGGG